MPAEKLSVVFRFDPVEAQVALRWVELVLAPSKLDSRGSGLDGEPVADLPAGLRRLQNNSRTPFNLVGQDYQFRSRQD
jgi:hypothetical protein